VVCPPAKGGGNHCTVAMEVNNTFLTSSGRRNEVFPHTFDFDTAKSKLRMRTLG